MSRLFRIVTLSALAVIAVACTQAGNNAPGGLPAVGTYSTPQPGAQTLCAGATNCAIIPDPYGTIANAPKDLAPTMVIPDHKDGIIPATIGVSAAFLIQTTNVSVVSAVCVPDQNATITANSSDGNSLLFFIAKMPAQDVSCTLTATGNAGSTSLPITLKAQAASPGAVKPIVVGLPVDTIKIKHGDTKSLSGISVSNQDANAKPLVVSCTYNTPKLVKAADGTYTLTITNTLPPDPNPVDLCTFLAINGDGAYTSTIIDFESLPADPQIVGTNFDKEKPLYIGVGKSGLFAYVDGAMTTFPQISIINQDNAQTFPQTITCDGASSSQFIVVPGSPPNTFQLNIVYDKAGVVGALQSCIITLGDDPATQYEFKFPTLIWK